MSQVKVDGYVEIPRRKWYQIEDIFTRIDEELEVLIKQVDYSNRLLEDAVNALNSIASAVQQIVPPAPPPTPPEVPPAPGKVISLPFKVMPIETKSCTVPEDTAMDVPLFGDLFILVADSDIYIGVRQDVQSFLLAAGVYLVMYRAPELVKIYVRSATGTANIYLMYLQVVS